MDVTLAPLDEVERLTALASYQLLDTPDDSVYEAFARLACDIVGTSLGAIALIDGNRQWFKAKIGLEMRETPGKEGLCASVVLLGRPLVVRDASLDARFSESALVTGAPNVRFYAGVPLTTPEGYTIGTLCVMDTVPRDLSAVQLAALEQIARATIAVLEARRRFLTLFDAAHIDVFAIDPRDETIVFASRGTCSRMQYPFHELVGMSLYDVIPAFTQAELAQDRERARRGEESMRDVELIRRDGTSYPVELRFEVTRETGEEWLLVIAIDQTVRKERERDLSILLRAMDAAGDVILIYGTNAAGELVLTYMNDAYAGQTGYSREEAIGKSIDVLRQFMPDDDGMATLRQAFHDGVPAQAEIVSYRKCGSSYWNQVSIQPIHDDGGVVDHWICVERDITEEVHRTAAIAEEHDRLLALTRAARRLFIALDTRSLIETIRDVVRELIPAHARVLAVNNDDRAIEVQELGAVDWSEAFSDDLIRNAVNYQMRVTNEPLDRAVGYAGRFGDARYVLELRSRASGVLRNTDLFVFDLIVEYFAVAARNVNLYRELDERRSAVLELSQTKSDLIAMLAHDVRGPLTSIVGFADLTGEVGEVNAEQREFLDTVKSSALQLSELATDTLTLSRLERNEVTLHVGDVDLDALLRDIVSQQANRRAIALEVQGDTHITGDEDRLRQVFNNLIDNAIKYSPNGDVPEIRVTGEPERIVITVRDRGIGIPASELSRVFDRFSRASNARKMRISGTGFGLFLTKQLLQLHGGSVTVQSAEDDGTTFTVVLPRRVDRRAAPRTIVILDPERDRSFLAYAVREAGYRVLTVGSLEEVLSAGDAQNVDALVLAAEEDLHVQQAAQYRAFSRERRIPIVAIANETSSSLGAAVTFPRPVLIGDLVSGLERLLGPTT